METAYTTDLNVTEEGEHELVFTKDEELDTSAEIRRVLLKLLVVLSLCSSLNMSFSDGLEYERLLRNKTLEFYRSELEAETAKKENRKD